MKRRTYQTTDGETFTVLRPENAAEAGALLTDLDEDPDELEVEHGGHQAEPTD